MFPVCCNAPCKAREYGVLPPVRHLYMLLPLVMPHVRHLCVLLPLVMLQIRYVFALLPLVMHLVSHAHLGSIQSEIGHKALTYHLYNL